MMIPDIKWYMGQPLLPDHLEYMQLALTQKTFTIANATGIDYYGAVKLEVEEAFLKMGVVRIPKFELITVSGDIIKLGLNATSEDYDLSSCEENKIELYVNVYKNNFQYDVAESSFNCQGYTLSYSPKADLSAAYCMKLLCIEKDLTQNWSISKGVIPATVTAGLSLFAEIRESISSLCEKIFTSYSRMEKDKDFLLKAVEYRPVLTAAYDLRFHLSSVMANKQVHPCWLYTELHKLYVRVCLFFNVELEDIDPYDHNEIFNCFDQILSKIDNLVSHEYRAIKYVKFELENNFYVAKDLSEEVLYAKNLYFVVQKRSAAQQFDINDTKLSSPGRYPTINKLALSGLKKTEVEKVTFQHYLSGNCQFFVLGMGKEWDYIIKDRAISFPYKEVYEDIKFYLYYF